MQERLFEVDDLGVNLEAFTRWGANRRNWREPTRRQYGGYIRRAVEHLGHGLETATRQELLAWLDTLPTGAPSRNGARNAIRAYYAYLMEIDEATVDPTARIDALKAKKRNPRALSADDRATVWSAARDEPPRVTLLVGAMLWAALRVSEARCLQWSHIDSQRLRVVEGKGGNDRSVVIVPPLAEAIAAVPRESQWMIPAAYDISQPANYQWCRRQVKRLSERVGVPFTPHSLRHSAATGLLESGADVTIVQHVLGHESLATTQGYLRIADDRVTRAMRNYAA